MIALTGNGAQAQSAPRYRFDPDWPKPLPNKWKIGGITGLAVDRDDNVWVLDRPNDLRDLELQAEIGIADCCVRPPSMIHIDKNGNVIGSFDPPQGHGMDVDSQGMVYIGSDTVRKYDPKSGKMLMEIMRAEPQPGAGGGGDEAPAQRQPGRGSAGPVGTFPQQGGGGAAAAMRTPLPRPRRRRRWRHGARSIRRRRPSSSDRSKRFGSTSRLARSTSRIARSADA